MTERKLEYTNIKNRTWDIISNFSFSAYYLDIICWELTNQRLSIFFKIIIPTFD